MLLLSAFVLFHTSVSSSYGQNIQTGNSYIVGDVQPANGKICILYPPGRLGVSARLNFYDKSFFSISINGQVLSNNDIITSGNRPSDFQLLNNGTSIKIANTIRTTWITVSGFNIIQDVFPVLFEKSGQIVMRWSVKNTTSSPAVASCQWLNDLQIADPTDHTKGHSQGQANVSDGPKILHQYGYHLKWEQFPDTVKKITTLPWFYMGFLWQLPDLNPGLCGQAYLDFPPIINKKPSRMTVGDWYTMTQTAIGANPSWPLGAALTTDDAVLLEWTGASVAPNSQSVVGITSYGTGEFDICNGNMFGVLIYPHKIHWLKDSSLYSPNPFKLELYALNPDKLTSSSNSNFTLTVGANLNIVDAPPTYSPIGSTQTLPTTGGGVFIAPNDVQVFDWYIKANPLTLCKGDIISSLKLTGVTTLGPPTFVRSSDGADTCEHDIVLECTETQASVRSVTENKHNILLTPNPMTDHIELKLQKIRSASIRIIDQLGHQLYSADAKNLEWNWNGKLIDGSTISTGSYIISISGMSEDGTPFKEERLLIKQ